MGIGASAGGLAAFETFFTQMPPDSGMAFVLVQHLAPDRESLLPALLARQTQMPVPQVTEETLVVPDHVYVIPPDATLTITGGVLGVQSPPGEPRGHRTPIDHFFRSLAEDQGEFAVCIMLSGTGTDGTLGLQAVKEYGGMALAQTPASAQYDGILRSAIATGLVDHILAAEDMPAKLIEYATHLTARRDLRGPDGLREGRGSHLRVPYGPAPPSRSRYLLLTEAWARSLCQPCPHSAFLMSPPPRAAAQKRRKRGRHAWRRAADQLPCTCCRSVSSPAR